MNEAGRETICSLPVLCYNGEKENEGRKSMKRLERIARYEQILDRAEAVARQAEEALEAYDAVQEELKELEKYYTGREWKADFDADAAGKLPPELKRGVLSEDGIDSVLERFRDLKERLG